MSVSVGSVDANDVKSGFGNYAAALNLSAPGEQIAVPAPEGYVGLWSGTSFSSPMVAGALALALADRVGGADVVQAMKDSAQPIDTLAGNAAYAGKLGARLDIAALLNRVTSP
jgi:thermitase